MVLSGYHSVTRRAASHGWRSSPRWLLIEQVGVVDGGGVAGGGLDAEAEQIGQPLAIAHITSRLLSGIVSRDDEASAPDVTAVRPQAVARDANADLAARTLAVVNDTTTLRRHVFVPR